MSSSGSSNKPVFNALGKLITERKLGEGGCGRTWLCYIHKSDPRKWVVQKKAWDWSKTEDKYPSEVRILREKLGIHPNINRLLSYGQQGQGEKARLWTTYEYCNQGNLHSHEPDFEHGGHFLPQDEIWNVFGQMAQALVYMHQGFKWISTGGAPEIKKDPAWSQPVIHRDISPDNIFLHENPHNVKYPIVILGDFGLATTEPTTSLLGKNHFQGPEPHMTAKTDIWALGCVIHALATGKDIFVPEPDWYRKVRKKGKAGPWDQTPEARKGILELREHVKYYSDELNHVMMACLKEREQDRPNAIGLFFMIEKVQRWAVEDVMMRDKGESVGGSSSSEKAGREEAGKEKTGNETKGSSSAKADKEKNGKEKKGKKKAR